MVLVHAVGMLRRKSSRVSPAYCPTQKVPMIAMAPVKDSLTLQCPCCGSARLRVNANSVEVIGSRYWLHDGDTIACLWQQLTDSQKKPFNFDYEMLVGACPSCNERYYVAEASFIAGDRQFTEPYLYRNVETQNDRFFSCTSSVALKGVPSSWLCQKTETPHGDLHSHTFGPFLLDSPEDVVGRNGVVACDASDNAAWVHSAAILLALWDDMRQPFLPSAYTAMTPA